MSGNTPLYSFFFSKRDSDGKLLALTGHITSHLKNQEQADLLDRLLEANGHSNEDPGIHVESMPLSVLGEAGLTSDLYGPLAGDPPVKRAEVKMKTRWFTNAHGEAEDRKGPTPMIDKPPRLASHMSVIWGNWGSGPICFTAYGHGSPLVFGLEVPVMAKEPWDCENPREISASEAEWADHALSLSALCMD
tara:strand:- start:704 stop:1276 length:573 start_codon:yes stop_codon:yes gene_type:complete